MQIRGGPIVLLPLSDISYPPPPPNMLLQPVSETP